MKRFITGVAITVVHVDDENSVVRVDEQEWEAPSLHDEDVVFAGITQEQLRDAESFLFEYEERPKCMAKPTGGGTPASTSTSASASSGTSSAS